MWIFSDAIKGGLLIQKAIEESKKRCFIPYPFYPPPAEYDDKSQLKDEEKREDNERELE